jgi:hypothetical protein
MFDGIGDAYTRNGALFGATDRFGFEAWAQAAEASVTGLKGVAANGNGGRGYVLGQSGARWVVFVGCVGSFDLGPVVPGRWTHLALVHDGAEFAAYLDGERIRSAAPTPGIEPVFRIGTGGQINEHFHGAIHRVRVFTFVPGDFDPDRDFLLDNDRRRQAAEQRRATQAGFIRALCAPQAGLTVVKKLDPQPAAGDWLIAPPEQPVELQLEPLADGQRARLALCNGLIARSFDLGLNLACFDYRLLRTRASRGQFLVLNTTRLISAAARAPTLDPPIERRIDNAKNRSRQLLPFWGACGQVSPAAPFVEGSPLLDG